MDLRRDLLFSVALVASLNLLFTLVAIGLFTRMAPAIERILQENMASIDAANQVLIQLARNPGEAAEASAREKAKQALSVARRNVTEAAEQPVLESLDAHLDPALQGDHEARLVALADLQRLIRINREAMLAVDAEAQRLSLAGAWTAVAVGCLSFWLALFGLLRLNRRVLKPVEELAAVLEAAWGGNRMRRCRPGEAPRELERIQQDVNRLLDERLRP